MTHPVQPRGSVFIVVGALCFEQALMCEQLVPLGAIIARLGKFTPPWAASWSLRAVMVEVGAAEHLVQQVHVLTFLAHRNQNPSVNTEDKSKPHQQKRDWRQHTAERELHDQADRACQKTCQKRLFGSLPKIRPSNASAVFRPSGNRNDHECHSHRVPQGDPYWVHGSDLVRSPRSPPALLPR